MDKYTASNGYTVADGAATIRNRAGDVRHRLGKHSIDALREFFRAERDEELGRWRWPENPDYVVYAYSDDVVAVFDERESQKQPDRITRRYCEDPVGSPGWGEDAARAYFEAHPVRKPWEDAKTGELWELWLTGATVRVKAVAGYEGAYRVFYADQGNVYASTDMDISHAVRIWPESD